MRAIFGNRYQAKPEFRPIEGPESGNGRRSHGWIWTKHRLRARALGTRLANAGANGRSSALGATRRMAPFAIVAVAAFVAVILVGTGSRTGRGDRRRCPAGVARWPRSTWCRGGGSRRGRRRHRRCSTSRSSRSCVTPRAPTRRSSPRSSSCPCSGSRSTGRAPSLLVSLAGLFVTLAAPALIAGAPDYPPRAELVRAFLWLLIAGGVGFTVHRLVLEVRARFVEYRSILETAHESFISAEPDGRIADWNQQAERDFGWSRDEVMGRDLAETVIPPRFRDVYREGFDDLAAHGPARAPRAAVRDAGPTPRRHRVPGRDHGLGAAAPTVVTGSTRSFTTSRSATRATARCARPRSGSGAPSTTARAGWRSSARRVSGCR